MEKLTAIWDFLDGRKTSIGAGFLIAGRILSKYPTTMIAGEICSEIGFYLTAGGLVHKGVKMALPAKP